MTEVLAPIFAVAALMGIVASAPASPPAARPVVQLVVPSTGVAR